MQNSVSMTAGGNNKGKIREKGDAANKKLKNLRKKLDKSKDGVIYYLHSKITCDRKRVALAGLLTESRRRWKPTEARRVNYISRGAPKNGDGGCPLQQTGIS